MSGVSSKQGPTGWHRNAIFYMLPVRSFFDSNGDGVGDFAGLMSKLDYIEELGATWLWLLPYFPSPLRDDGYDIADFRDVHPSLGTMAEFRSFLEEAHRRGLKVIAEIVINHTSESHPWFQAARSAPPNSPLREFYVWSDTADRFRDVAVRFADVERSNWTWDDEAHAFYWHRFFAHQPELNYDNPQVRDEMIRVLRFWADVGLDGLCLTGAPYLVEREGTTCEHLAETHEILKQFRRELERDWPQLLLVAGVNAWPSEAASYFAEGDECLAATNFALAERLFQAIRQEDRHPIADILHKTPPPPDGCQWVVLLRNHDELTLTLATDEERDYMYRAYAADERMRRHSGILRRLAPLVENSRPKIELLFRLLFALPGAPVIYYGDEIGMGDNVRLARRDVVRTPMQWSSDRNGGFSDTDPQHIDPPPVSDPVYGYQAVNVAARRRDGSSLFHAMRRLIGVRKRHPTLANGSLELWDVSNRKIVAFVRGRESAEPILVVANLSRTTQPVELDLTAFAGFIPVEMHGGSAFPKIGKSPYVFSLGPHAVEWFELRRTAIDLASRLVPVATEDRTSIPTIAIAEGSHDLFTGESRETLERDVLPAFLRAQRWFGGKARRIESIRIADWGTLPTDRTQSFFVLLDVTFAGGTNDLYFVPLAITRGPAAARFRGELRTSLVAILTGREGEAALHDALADDETCCTLLAIAGDEQTIATQSGKFRGMTTSAFATLRGDPNHRLPVSLGPATSSNSLVFYGKRLLFKLFRRLEPGINPDDEIGRFLTESDRFDRLPQVAGSFEYESPDGNVYSLGILQALVPNQGDGWRHSIDELKRYYERAAARMDGPDRPTADPRPLLELVSLSPEPAVLEAIGVYLHYASLLGRRTAEMHLALASDTTNPDFAPEPLDRSDLDAVREEILSLAGESIAMLGEQVEALPPDVALSARKLLDEGPLALERLANEAGPVPQSVKTRIHGDYHLGQVLWTDGDYVIIDFEGEPTRSVAERRGKFSPLRDVAGMLRSYHYAAFAALFAFTAARQDDLRRLLPWADLWRQWTSAAFLREYLATADDAAFLPKNPREFTALLETLALAKSLYELKYELNNRPDWIRIPLEGVLSLLESSNRKSEIGNGK